MIFEGGKGRFGEGGGMRGEVTILSYLRLVDMVVIHIG